MPATHWTAVLSAGAGSEAALEMLCQLYWAPICAYLERWSRRPQEAEDLTQVFLTQFIRKNPLPRLSPARGRFRSYLLKSLNRFLADEASKTPEPQFLSLRDLTDETARGWEVADASPSPDQEFDLSFTLALIQRTLDLLRADYGRRGQSERFEVLERFLPGKDAGLSQAEAARQLGLSEGAVAKAVHDLRARFGETFRQQVGQTVSCYEEVEEEIAHHLNVLAR